MKYLFLFLFLFCFLFIIFCNNNKHNNQSIFKKYCHSPIEIINPSGEITKIEPDGEKIKFIFNKDIGVKYYVIYDTIKINFKSNFNDDLLYILAYNTLHNTKRYLAYIRDKKYGIWISDAIDSKNIDIFNEFISSFKLVIDNEEDVINLALLYLRLINNGNLERLYLRGIEDIWLLSQFYDKSTGNWYIDEINDIDGQFGYEELTKKSNYISMQPKEYPDYQRIFNKYQNIIKKPQVINIEDIFNVEFYTWGHFSGNIEKWDLAVEKRTANIISVERKIIEKNIGHIRTSFGILSYP